MIQDTNTASGAADDSLLLCASDLQHSAIYDNHAEMQACIRAVANRIAALASAAAPAEREVVMFPNYDLDGVDWIMMQQVLVKLGVPTGEVVELKNNVPRFFNSVLHAVASQSAPQTDTTYAELPMESAPKDGTMLRLQVMFEDGALEDDNSKPIWTIGFNNLGNTGEDEWQFAGWNWSHDCFSEGTGTPVGWLPMLLDASSASHGQAPAGWAIVPADATDAMMAAFAKAAAAEVDWHGATEVERQEVRDGFGPAYRAMLAAAPTPSITPQADSQPVILHQEAARAMLKEMDMNDRVLAAIDADPKKCTAQVRCINGRITTESCTTKAPLISNGESSDGERDYYICPDCRKDITIDYREN